MPETILLKQHFYKTADPGNMEVPETSSLTATTARKVRKFGCLSSQWQGRIRFILPHPELPKRKEIKT